MYLTGFMGTGKSVVGRALARRLKRPFADLDALIERRSGLSIPRFFEARGERAFRALESRLLAEVARRRGWVVALGGGALLDKNSLRRVRATGTVVALTCARGELWRRLKRQAGTRPLLAGAAPRRRFEELLDKRRTHYDRVSRVRLSTTDFSPRAAASRAARLLAARGCL